MKLREIYKKILLEKDEDAKKSKKEEITGKVRITIEANDDGGELQKVLQWMKSMGDIGHSAVMHCDVEQPSEIVKIFWDGDGSDKIYDIKVEKMKEDETRN